MFVIQSFSSNPIQLQLSTNFYSSLYPILSYNSSRVALVYAGPTFHDEVASVAACILHDLGFFVVVYIGNGVHFGGMMVPFSGEKFNSNNNTQSIFRLLWNTS